MKSRADNAQWPPRTHPEAVAYSPVAAHEAAATGADVGVDAGLGYFVESAEPCFDWRLQIVHDSISSIVGISLFDMLGGRQSEMRRPHCRQTNWRHQRLRAQGVMVDVPARNHAKTSLLHERPSREADSSETGSRRLDRARGLGKGRHTLCFGVPAAW